MRARNSPSASALSRVAPPARGTLLLLLGLATGLLLAGSLFGAAQLPNLPAASDSPTTAPATGRSAPTSEVSLGEEGLTRLRERAAADLNLDAETRAELVEAYGKAIENVQAAAAAAQAAAALQAELEQAPRQVEELERRLDDPPAADSRLIPPDLTVTELQTGLKDAEREVASQRQQQQSILAEMEQRRLQRPRLPELQAQVQQQLDEVKKLLDAPAPADERPDMTAARTTRLRTRLERLQREAELLDQQARTYEATVQLWTLRRDLVETELRDAEKQLGRWQQRLTDALRNAAETAAAEAREAATEAAPGLRREAARNAELAEANAQLVESLQESQQQLSDVEDQLQTRLEDFRNLQRRAEAASFSQAIGVLLRNQQTALPDADRLRKQTREREEKIAALNLQLMEWEAERRRLADLDAALAAGLDDISTAGPAPAPLRDELAGILAKRRDLLTDLLVRGTAQLDRLVRIDGRERELIAAIDEEGHWLAEHVLWVRSARVVGSQPAQFLSSLRALADAGNWRTVVATLSQELRRTLGWAAVAGLSLSVLLGFRRRAKRALRALGQEARRSTMLDFWPTLQATLLSLVVAAPVPLFLMLVGWRLQVAGLGEPFTEALGYSLLVTGGLGLIVQLVRATAYGDGLGEAHFFWSDSVMATLRRATRLLAYAVLPAAFVAAFVYQWGDEAANNTVGRAAFLAALVLLDLALIPLLRPSGPLLRSLAADDTSPLLHRLRWVLPNAVLVAPALLALLSAAGYHYTALQLARRLVASLGWVLAVVLVRALVARWLLVTYRRLAIQRGRERREILQQQQANEPETDQPLPVDASTEFKLSDINQQARRLLQLAAAALTVAGLYVIWIDVVPALGVLRGIELWPNHLRATSVEKLIPWVTAADLVLAVLLAGLTLIAARNLPGVLEIALLQRLPLDAGARYAASTISRYAIVVTGLVLAFRQIGVGWSSVQWLVAAMGVGLGFGLQEIFANFVSGIILLFERPIRVGDTVTIGSITGTVMRIRIRATTILDWDNKELIVPNREFVTGHLVNWTLSNPTLRLIIRVGVAYGSDTRLVTRLLYQAAHDNPNVLRDPEPVVVFNEFGESSLNFELRLYVSGLLMYRRLKHELHTAIDELFREHQIEIAFPQRDLHVRTLPEGLQSLVENAAAEPESRRH